MQAGLVLAVLVAFLTVRSTPLSASSTSPSVHSTVAASATNLNRKPKIEFDSSQWSAPTDGNVPLLVARSKALTFAAQPLIELPTKGLRYNRPPPVI